MTEAKRSKRVKPDPELLKLADALLVNLPETRRPDWREWPAQAVDQDAG